MGDIKKPVKSDAKKEAGANDKGLEAHITTHAAMDHIPRSQWNALVPEDAPSLRHEFLEALERSGSCTTATGWTPCHITVHIGDTLVGGAPCYLKHHSYGEFIFDWAWANAYQRAGLKYYPKLLVAVPFTPVSGNRLLHHPEFESASIHSIIAGALPQIATRLGASSVHCLFCTDADLSPLTANGFVRRESYQFHWRNDDYRDFDDFLQKLSSKKRKNILRERRRVREQEITLHWLQGSQLNSSHLDFLTACYTNTIAEHGSYAYLSREFFAQLARELPDSVQLLRATRNGQDIACAFFIRGKTALFGRYWGALEQVSDLHFEVCYYAPIEYCIKHDLTRFEAGAQGEHKLSRGLTPEITLSAHWLAHREFHDAIGRYTIEESSQLAEYTRVLQAHTPFR
ncbi:MAG: N-acetyltransferase, partial [Acidiferrobacteraceae bacterium]|nr:N-acetyltransferase [Acidiferrobacteraceae bacterium]